MAEKRKRTPEEIRQEREEQIRRDEEALARKKRKLQVRDAKDDERAFISWLRDEMIAGRVPVDFEQLKEALLLSFAGTGAEAPASGAHEPAVDMFDPMADPADPSAAAV